MSAKLASYACHAASSCGRLYDETESINRGPFQRDRDRIIHCSAFRRLNHKTQVFIYHEGDHYRSRLTHSLEVAQIARTISRTLKLDEDLAEALALAHDLGHPPFGHAGERALNRVMADYGGFDHNAQSLRVVTHLERKYADFDGLNLTWETLEGLVKHNGPLTDERGQPVGEYSEKQVPGILSDFNKLYDLSLDKFSSAEAQVAALADDIAYNNHDIDDGLRAAIIELEHLKKMSITDRIISEIDKEYTSLEPRRMIFEINRRLISYMVRDVVRHATENIASHDIKTIEDIRNADQTLVTFSDNLIDELDELRFFLMSWVYRNSRVDRIMDDAAKIVEDLFKKYLNEPTELPEQWHNIAIEASEYDRARLICDFVAGMTDRFAINEHVRLFDWTPELR